MDFSQLPHGKPPAIPRRQLFNKSPIAPAISDEKNLSQSNLDHLTENTPPKSFSPSISSNMQSTIIRRTKRKMLEEHMLKRFSTGDYSTRSLIEWENNLNMTNIQQLSISGEFPSKRKILNRQLSCQPSPIYPISLSDQLQQMPIVYNYTSELNILHYSSTESFKDPQVSFSLKNPNIESKDKTKRSGFIQRSLNDIFMAFRNATSSDKPSGSRKYLFSSHKSSFHFKHHRLEKKRVSLSLFL